jgi:hypothetical protein
MEEETITTAMSFSGTVTMEQTKDGLLIRLASISQDSH